MARGHWPDSPVCSLPAVVYFLSALLQMLTNLLRAYQVGPTSPYPGGGAVLVTQLPSIPLALQ